MEGGKARLHAIYNEIIAPNKSDRERLNSILNFNNELAASSIAPAEVQGRAQIENTMVMLLDGVHEEIVSKKRLLEAEDIEAKRQKVEETEPAHKEPEVTQTEPTLNETKVTQAEPEVVKTETTEAPPEST